MALTKVGKEGITGISNSSDVTAITIDSSKKVGIGNASPPEMLSVGDTSDTNVRLRLTSSTSGAGTIQFGDGTGASGYRGYINYTHSDDALVFATSATERMRIESSGNVLVGTSSQISGGAHLQVSQDVIGSFAGYISNTASSGGYGLGVNSVSGDNMWFYFNGVYKGRISTSSSGTSYSSASDYRLKENVTYDWDATTRLKQLKPARFNFIADADTTVDGFLAHEAQAVVPEAVTGTKDEADDDGNPVMQGIDQAKLVPLLVKTLQEAITKIETLEAKVQALEDA